MTTTCDHHKERGLNCPFWDSFHNRLELICSMPVRDNPLREYPLRVPVLRAATSVLVVVCLERVI